MPKNANKNPLLQYATLASQITIALIIAVYAGKWFDEKSNAAKPLWIWILPLIVLIAMMLKVIKDTSKK